MVKNLTIIATLCCLLGFAGCGSGGGSSGSGSSVQENGPLAGTWRVSVNGVTHAITISGLGNTYDAAWDTSDDCFMSESGTTVHSDLNVEILCCGYDDIQQKGISFSILANSTA